MSGRLNLDGSETMWAESETKKSTTRKPRERTIKTKTP